MTAKKVNFNFYEYLIPSIMMGGILLILIYAKGIILPIVLSFAVAYLLNPLISWFEARGFNRLFITAALYVFITALLALIIYIAVEKIASETATMVELWPEYYERFNALIASAEKSIISKAPFLSGLGINIAGITKFIDGKVSAVPLYIISIIPTLTFLILVPFVSFLLLIDVDKIKQSLFGLVPSSFVEPVQHVICEANQSLGNYLRGILIEVTALSSVSAIVFLYMDLNYAVLLALALGFSAIIPYIGPVCAGILCAVLAFIQFGTINSAVSVIIYIVILRFVDDWFMQPYIMKNAVQVHPIIIFLALMAGAEMFGILGIIFAMPATCIIKVVYTILMEFQRSIFGWKPTPEPTRISIPYT